MKCIWRKSLFVDDKMLKIYLCFRSYCEYNGTRSNKYSVKWKRGIFEEQGHLC